MKSLEYALWWVNGTATLEDISDQVAVRINTDYEDRVITGTEAKSWTETNLMGGISNQVLRYQLKRGSAYPPGWTDAQEEEATNEIRRNLLIAKAITDTSAPLGATDDGNQQRPRIGRESEEMPKEGALPINPTIDRDPQHVE